METDTSDISRNINNTSGLQTQSGRGRRTGSKAQGNRCLVLLTVSLGLVCILLLITIILQHFMITAERDKIKSYKSTAEEFNQTMYCLHSRYTEVEEKKLELESKDTPLSNELKKDASKQGNLCAADGFFTSIEMKNWSDSRQFCRDHGFDLLIIKSKVKQTTVSKFIKEKMGLTVWIGLSDIEKEGSMKWVDNSPLNNGFWIKGEPNDLAGNEDCVIMNPSSILENWNDIPCSEKGRFLCE
ncbi:CD209 antigen-like protein A [Carassius carassius]|uniref:CD209 antigen-like protein A n=1 Tax=Carassius carassius TaxID=217509 RepID=UPI002868688B|nr:CD209 antigen-like protein A [Carassius carassius]